MAAKKRLALIIPERLFEKFHEYRKECGAQVSEMGIEILCDFFDVDVESMMNPTEEIGKNATQLNIIDYIEKDNIA